MSNEKSSTELGNALASGELSCIQEGMHKYGAFFLIAVGLLLSSVARAQLDPEKRELIQVGGSQALEGASPLNAYGFYYLNEPNFLKTNVTLRLALAPVYLDSEVGFVHLLGPNTDLGLGFAGGAFADSYFEFDKGKYNPKTSFFGNSIEGSASIYHTFDPGKLIPLYGILRIKEHYSSYTGDDTAENFTLPNDHSTIDWRAGLRLGGREPLLHPAVAMEISAWAEGLYRSDSGSYGFDGDRVLNEYTQLFWARALLIYTFTNSGQSFDVNLTGGGSIQADRLSAYRLGGDLPLISEFPLSIPGYFYQELSARDFVCFNAAYTIPLDAGHVWSLNPMGAVATMNYLPALAQQGDFNSGAGLGVGYHSRNGVWQGLVDWGYGFEAIRSDGRGAQSIGFMLQIDLEARHPHGRSYLDRAFGVFP